MTQNMTPGDVLEEGNVKRIYNLDLLFYEETFSVALEKLLSNLYCRKTSSVQQYEYENYRHCGKEKRP